MLHGQRKRADTSSNTKGGHILRKNWEPLTVNCLGNKEYLFHRFAGNLGRRIRIGKIWWTKPVKAMAVWKGFYPSIKRWCKDILPGTEHTLFCPWQQQRCKQLICVEPALNFNQFLNPEHKNRKLTHASCRIHQVHVGACDKSFGLWAGRGKGHEFYYTWNGSFGQATLTFRPTCPRKGAWAINGRKAQTRQPRPKGVHYGSLSSLFCQESSGSADPGQINTI